jgi:transmembrane sensor
MCPPPADSDRSVPLDSHVLDHPRDAAQWFAGMHSGEVTDEERRAFAAWLAASPDHAQQYRSMDYLWSAARRIPEARLRAMAQDAVPAPILRASRRRMGLGLAAACLLVAMVTLSGTSVAPGARADTLDFSTHKGERRQARLPDGSMLTLNGDTHVVVRFQDERRQVELRQGEAFFDVRRDATRPFLVDAGMGQVKVTGTRFNVRRDATAMQVTVESGSVLVQSGQWWHRSERRLTAGEQTVAYPNQALSAVDTINVGQVMAWQRGKVIFNGEPLGKVITDMNRYLAQPLLFEAPSLAQHRVSGIFNVDDPQSMIDALPAIAPVNVVPQHDGSLRIVSR